MSANPPDKALSPWAQDILRRAERAVSATPHVPRRIIAGPEPVAGQEPMPAPVAVDDLTLARHHFHELSTVIERMLARLEVAAIPRSQSHAAATEQEAAPIPDAELPPEPHHTDPTLLLATEMAAAGHPRGQVAARLREEFGVADPSEVLEAVFGPPAPGDPGRPRG